MRWYDFIMEYGTDTFTLMNDLIGTYGIKDDYLWSIIGPDAFIMHRADVGYIELLGPTLQRVKNLHAACALMSRQKNLPVAVSSFIQEQMLAHDKDGKTEYLTAGEFIAQGLLNPEDAVFIAGHATEEELKESKVLQNDTTYISWKPNGYQHFLRAIKH
jgi:hypothetical protein